MAHSRDDQLTLDQAYQAAYLWLDHVGEPPIEISEPSHGAVELVTQTAFVRIRSSDGPVEQSSVLALLRAADRGKRLMLFSPSGFSPGALSIAETQGIALFSLDKHGRTTPETTHARSIAPHTEPDPPFAPPPEDSDDDDFRSYTPLPTTTDDGPLGQQDVEGIDAAHTDWSDCPSCGTTHYRNAHFCKSCGTRLRTASGGEQAQMRCRSCGSRDIDPAG